MMSGGYSQKLGIICGLCTFVASVAAPFAAMKGVINKAAEKELAADYGREVTYAKAAVQLKNDDEIRAFLAGHASFDDTRVAPEDIGDDQVAEFKTKLPELRLYASGQLTKNAYIKSHSEVAESGLWNVLLLLFSVGIFGMISLCAGTGLAFRLGSGEVE
jgi:hypothetical protein